MMRSEVRKDQKDDEKKKVIDPKEYEKLKAFWDWSRLTDKMQFIVDWEERKGAR